MSLAAAGLGAANAAAGGGARAPNLGGGAGSSAGAASTAGSGDFGAEVAPQPPALSVSSVVDAPADEPLGLIGVVYSSDSESGSESDASNGSLRVSQEVD